MTPFSDVLEQASGLVAGVAGARLGSLRDEELLMHVADVERLGRLVDALRVAAAGEVDERSGLVHGPECLCRRHRCATGALLIEQLTRTSQSEAARRVRIGRATAEHLTLTGEIVPAPFAHMAAALASGELGLDAAAAIIRHLTDASRTASPAAVRDAEAHLVDQAATLSASLVAIQAQQICAALDPDGVQPREDVLRQQRRFRLGREVDGLTPFSGLADPINAGLLRAALSERTAPSRTPRFVDPDDPDVSLEP